MKSDRRTRRQLLKGGAALAGLAMAGVRSASAAEGSNGIPPDLTWGENPDRFWPPGPKGTGGASSYFPENHNTALQDVMGIITPSRKTNSNAHRGLVPNINANEHTFLIHGMVDRPIIFTMADLKRLPSVNRIHYVACAGQAYLGLQSRTNPGKTPQQTHGATGCSEWTGVLLSTVLEMAGVQKGGDWLSAESVDAKKHAMDIPLSKGMDDVILAYGQNGGPVVPEHGYPLKLLVPGSEGTRNIKWLRRIKVCNQPQMTNYEIKCYANWKKQDGKARWFQFEMEPGGVITYPSGDKPLSGPGFYEITGLAWSGGGAVHRVEVSVDHGKTWQDAKLQEPLLRKAYTRFRLPWNWDGREAVLMSRTTDETGDIQPLLSELTRIWNVTPEYWVTSTNRIQHFNACQPWKVNTDGTITNVMFDPTNNV